MSAVAKPQRYRCGNVPLVGDRVRMLDGRQRKRKQGDERRFERYWTYRVYAVVDSGSSGIKLQRQVLYPRVNWIALEDLFSAKLFVLESRETEPPKCRFKESA